MEAEATMTIDERRKYLRRMPVRYVATDRAGRKALLADLEAVTGLHRKSRTRLLRGAFLDAASTPGAPGAGLRAKASV